MKKILKRCGLAALAVPVLLAVSAALLYFPPVQQWAVSKASAYASRQTGMDVSVGKVRLRFPLDLSMEDVKVIQPNDSLPQVRDTVAAVGSVKVDVQLLPLLKKQVQIDALELNDVTFNTTNFVKSARVKGTVGKLSLESHGIDLKNDLLRLDRAELEDACVDVALNDTVPPDTTKSENNWRILADRLTVKNSDVAVHMPGDTLQVKVRLGQADVRNGSFDLGTGRYEVGSLDVKESSVKYDNRFAPRQKGLDYQHLDLTDVSFSIDSLTYQEPKLDMRLRHASMKEKSGLQIDKLSGYVKMDDKRLLIPGMKLSTPESELEMDLDMDMKTFSATTPGQLNGTIHAKLGKQDLMQFMGDMPQDFKRRWPNQPLSIDGVARGNMDRMHFTGLNLKLPGAFNVRATGQVANLDDLKHLKADVDIDAKTQNVDFVKALLDKEMQRQLRLPATQLKGNVKVDGSRYDADITAKEGGGSVRVNGTLDADRMKYKARVKAHAMPLQHYLPGKGLHPLTADIDVDGQGVDLMSPHTRLNAKANITKFEYDGYRLDGMTADARVSGGHGRAHVTSHNGLLDGNVTVDALLNTKNIRATVAADVIKADLKKLGLTSETFDVGLCGHVDVATNQRDYYKVQGFVSDITVYNRGERFRPEDIELDILTRRDTTRAIVDCGDFHLNMAARGGYEQLLRTGRLVADEVSKQTRERTIDQVRLRECLPDARVRLTSGKNNFLAKMLGRLGYGVKAVDMDLSSSPVGGLNGTVRVDSLIAAGVQLDTIRLALRSSDDKMTYHAQIRNNKQNPQYTFNALFEGCIEERGTSFTAHLFDEKGKLGLGVGLAAIMEDAGLRLRFNDMDPVLGYKKFKANDDHYIFLSNDQRVSANLSLRGENGEAVQLYSNDDNLEALQDITLSLHRFNLAEMLSVLPYAPKLTGVANGDFHVIKTADELSVSSDLSVDKLTYENCPMGNMSTEFVYMPKEDGSHYVDGILMQDGEEVGLLRGTYSGEGEGSLDAELQLERMPLSVVNGFIPDQLFGLKGFAEGTLAVKGPLKRPQVDGELFLDEGWLVSEPYGMQLRFANDPVRIVNSRLLLENFEIFGHNNNPLNLYGNIDFSNLDRPTMDLRMKADNYQLIDSKETHRSVAYGKAFVNFYGRMNGPLDDLTMRGKLDVLGTSDVGYILRDSPLTTDNQLDELVKFTNLNDSLEEAVIRPELNGFKMDMTIDISKGAHVMAYLNADHTNYIDLMGGGNLRMRYTPADHLQLNGKYTLSNGEMKYSLPIIPLKTFTIQDGSYLEFTGDVMNPTLNITATEQTKATVTGNSGVGRSVAFDCGVIITKTLNDMGLEFTLDAPEDLSLHNELMAMSKEQRGKLAVSLLTTGMYLADGNTSAFSMNSALSSFLNSEINNITGNALRTLDLSFGLDNSTDATGNTHMDYSFKFAKRLWNNRLKITVGGKVSTGSDYLDRNDSFFDNVTLEYRLDDTANKYINLFFQNNAYDWLDGYTQEYGGGFIWRRSLQHFKDIFSLKGEKPLVVPQRRDSITVQRDTTKTFKHEE